MENLLCQEFNDISVHLYTPAFKPLVNKCPKTLYDCIKNINYANLTNGFPDELKRETSDEKLLNHKTLQIAELLAIAIDKNSVSEVKKLKSKYGNCEEFNDAKNILNKKCKQLWNAYETKDRILKIPKDAMKALGITNKPSLDFLLSASIRYFEKDDEDTTSFIIESILKNKNLNYSVIDIHRYLKQMNKKENCRYNFNTAVYFIKKHHYTKSDLFDLGFDEITVKRAVKSLNLADRTKYYYSDLMRKI